MKKFLLIAVAAFGMLMTACSKDEVAQPVGGEESVVTFTISTPELATRAHGDGLTATVLKYAVYNRVDGSKLFEGQPETITDKTAIVDIPFVNGMTYDVLFWAEAPTSPYAVNFDAKTVAYANADDLDSNSEAYDAFYAYVNDIPTISGPVTKSVVLKRPFAQLNIITNDATEAAQSGVTVKDVKVVVEGAYTDFDLANHKGLTKGTVTFDTAAAQTTTNVLAVNYLFPAAEKSLVDVEFTYTDMAGKLGTNGLTKEFATVPIQRNYRTNIVGSLLTSDGTFDVVIEKNFETEEHDVEVVSVASAVELVDEITNGDADQVILTGDINLNDLLSRAADKNLVIPAGRTVTLDLGGYTLSAVSTQTGVNYEMIDVRGTLTVANGTITTEHKGENMEWSKSTNVFNVTAGGVLNLEGVTAKNLGGSDMAFVAHLNNWGEVTLNVNNSTLESPYVAVRVFNSGYDMNNVTIKNSTLKAKNCVWVHNYTAADFGTQDKANAQKALLNFDIFNGTNTFEYTSAVARLGFTNSVNLNADGHIAVYSTDDLARAIAAGGELTLQNDIETSEIIVIDNSIVLDGNGKTLKSTAGRAINVSGADGVTIKNLTINCSGERAINVIQNATNVTIENVTATAANYTVNVASSAPEAVVAIKNSTLNGLCTVNVSAAGANVTVDGCTVNCNDNNTTVGEVYAAVSLNKEAVNGVIAVTNSTINVAEGSDSKIARNGAPNGTVTINGSTEGVSVMVAAITYEGSSYYYAFETFEAAVEFAKEGDVITLIRDIKLSENITVTNSLVVAEGVEITLDLNGKTLEGTMHKSVGAVLKNMGTLTVKNGTISSTADNGGSAILNNGTLTVNGATLNGAPNANGSWPSYTVNNTGVMTVNNVTITSHHGAVASYGDGAVVTLNDSEIDMAGIPGFTSHGMYTYNNGKVIVNGGTYANKATDQAASGASVINGAVEVNDGTFTGRIENYYGTPVLKGGTYSVKPNAAWVATGYKVIESGDNYVVVAE